MTAELGYWASNEFFDQTTASRKFLRPFARSMTASVQHRRIQTLPKPFDLLPEPPIADPAISARVMKLVRTADIKSAASSNACRFDPASGANDDQSLAQASTASYRCFF
jgi:hypothetical protein